MNSKVLKIIGIVASGVGLLVTLTKDWVDEQTLDAKIDEKLNARSINQDDEEESYGSSFYFSQGGIRK